MRNHIHLIAVPKNESSLTKGVGEAHKQYSHIINFREDIITTNCLRQLASNSIG